MSGAGKGTEVYTIEYPFKFGEPVCKKNETAGISALDISADVSSDARFFVATGVLSCLYCIFISAVYACVDEIYTSKPEVPLAVSRSISDHYIKISKKNTFDKHGHLFWFCRTLC